MLCLGEYKWQGEEGSELNRRSKSDLQILRSYWFSSYLNEEGVFVQGRYLV
jgi:hypothetical protein